MPPYPFAEWPYGGTSNLGSTRPNSVDSPLMLALGNTAVGKALNDAHIQIYGWGDVGGNLSTNRVHGGNVPAGYDYNPNRIQFDQGVLYIERLPDTVQQDHVDWGFRIAPIFGADYRYTTAFGYPRATSSRSTARSGGRGIVTRGRRPSASYSGIG